MGLDVDFRQPDDENWNNPDVQDVLKEIDPLQLMDRITHFRKLNISRMTDQEILDAIINVLCVNNCFCCYSNLRVYPQGTKFFRVKRFKGHTLPDPRFRIYADYWETDPKYLTQYGRLNKPHESLLYTAPDLFCAVDEVKISENEYFAAIQYTAISPVKVNMIGGEIDYKLNGATDKQAILVHEIYNSFLRDEFSRDVGKGTEYLYKTSEIIAKTFFDLPPRDVQDAWAYSSVQNKEKYNVCFRPEIAHDILRLDGALICRRSKDNQVEVVCVAIGANEKGDIVFYPLGSEPQQTVFPELNRHQNMT